MVERATFYLLPGISIEERAERLANRPCYCADPEKTTACAYCFALAHFQAAHNELVEKIAKQFDANDCPAVAAMIRNGFLIPKAKLVLP